MGKKGGEKLMGLFRNKPGEILKGKVKWYNVKHGYGFIEQENGKGDIFVHHSQIEGPGDLKHVLVNGEEVTYQLRESKKGMEAFGVIRKDPRIMPWKIRNIRSRCPVCGAEIGN
jgi:CspA family cold shock protein